MLKKVIGIYQLITGIFGIVIIVGSAIALGSDLYNQSIILIQMVLGVFLYGSLAWAGYSLMMSFPKSFRKSIAIQLIQIPSFAISGLLYKFSAASFVFIGISMSKLLFNVTIKPVDFALTTNLQNEQFYGIYLVPLILFILLLKLRRD